MIPVIEPGEETDLFGDTFSIERLAEPDASSHTACFLMTRRWPGPSNPRTKEMP